MRLLRNAAEINVELIRLIGTCTSCQVAVAWASSHFDAFCLLMENKDKITRMVVGTHFYQTHPKFIESLLDHPHVKFVMNMEGVFHPKVYSFEKAGGSWECIIGSPNFTKGGVCLNDEMAVLVTDEDNGAQAFLSGLQESIAEYWKKAKVFGRVELSAYQDNWKRKKRSLKKLRVRIRQAIVKNASHGHAIEKQVLVEHFARAVQDVLSKYGPMTTAQIYRKIQEDHQQLCTDRGMDRSYSVWQRDARP